jgi:raffinose/stachyose/melibiose transport system substrate-binding protein
MKKLFGLLMIFAFVMGMTGCQPVAAPTEAPQPAQVQPTQAAPAAPADTAAPVPTQASAAQVVTIKVLDQFTAEPDNTGMETLDKMFMEKFPSIKIQRDTITSDNMRTMVQTTLASGTGPDIIYYDTGPGFGGVLANAGLLLPLDDYYSLYKWDDRIFTWTKARTTFKGKVFGIGNELEFVGAYYNKTLFDKLGLSVPKTYDDLIPLCQKAKAAGYVPIAFADADKWEAYHQFSLVTNNLIGPTGIDNILHGDGRWDTPEIAKAIQLFFVDMNKAGCFIPDTTAVKYDDGNSLFYSGKALMDFTGSWLIADITTNVKDFEVGWFFFPSIDGKPTYPPAGLGSGYFVSAATKNPKEATQYLDFLFSQEAAPVWLETMNKIPPIKVDITNMKIPPLLGFAVQALQTQEMGYNIDVLTPDNFNTAMGDGFQSVLLGEKTPDQQAKDLEKAWEDAVTAGKVTK